MELTSQARVMRDWLSKEWSEKLAVILESIADKRPTVERPEETRETKALDSNTLIWGQAFEISPDPVLWVATPRAAAIELGQRTLQAAGVDAVADEDAENTFMEILNQSLSALGHSIALYLVCDAAPTEGEQVASPPQMDWMPVRLGFEGESIQPIWLAASPWLLERLASGPAAESEDEPVVEAAAEIASAAPEAPITAGSKTFDLLLDVSLPVSISFGRTFLPIKDVLKLNSGSIVELDRGVGEPVDVIVNNCVIARGEVVVIEGNYGVRIHHIASRTDRLRTGTSSAQVQHALTAAS